MRTAYYLLALDIPEIISRFGGDREFAAECAGLFADELPAMLEALREGLRLESAERVNRAAHALKGAAGNFSLAGPTVTAGEMERLARDGRLEDARPLQSVLERELARLLEGLQGLK